MASHTLEVTRSLLTLAWMHTFRIESAVSVITGYPAPVLSMLRLCAAITLLRSASKI